MKRTLPPILRRAATISPLSLTGTTPSLPPWTTQTGTSLIRSTSSGSPPPQMGTTAAKRPGYSQASIQLPKPPMLRPDR